MNRRNILKAGISSAISSLLATTTTAQAAEIQFNLIAEAYTKTLIDGSTVTAWRLRDLAGSSLHQLSANLKVSEGDNITINLQNNLNQTIRLTVPGENLQGLSCLPGQSQNYTLSANTAGSFLLCAENELFRYMGLLCPLIVTPGNNNQLRQGGPFFQREYTLVLHDSDTALHQAQALNFPRQDYRPNYFFINGLSFPDTNLNNNRILASLNQTIAVRFINAGSMLYPMHLHGYHASVDSRNRQVENDIVEKDTILILPLECVDVLIDVNQAGIFPLHSHYLPSVTNNGIYTGGCVAIIEAQA